MSYVVALDFEAAGGVCKKHGFTQLGGVIVRVKDGVVLHKFNEYASMDGYEWEDRTYNEFWSKHPERHLETVDKTKGSDVKSPYEIVDLFIIWVKKHTETFKDDVYFISDNAAFDVAILRYFSSTDIMYIFGKYTEFVDISSVYLGFYGRPIKSSVMDKSGKQLALNGINMNKKLKLEKPEFEVSKDHNPVNDAEEMALYWCFFQREIKPDYCFDHMDGNCTRDPDLCHYSHDLPSVDSEEYASVLVRKNEYLEKKANKSLTLGRYY